jgi:hypothetical protein
MTVYPLDVDAGQVVNWLREQQTLDDHALEVRASRSFSADTIEQRPELGFGDEEAEDLTAVAVTGLLEAEPRGHPNGWVLRIRVEDELAPRSLDDEPVPEGEEALDLTAFEELFIEPRTGTAFVEVEAETDEAWNHFEVLLSEILTNRHAK